ncbi:pentapeptide repeat-containing protein [Ancylothrix sp. C2]|uniref:pentapeptide repeat-containing protein n=1 Tax=Ancylothrix sp. D3o TaxID=2953691 RepID=UPI0021BA522B|nr:pentapeptide repeat-containing protein [Ancylothrix sp. D3o]MCT7953468.1 pentapeptide repeat-containing protein [Ancylothrix sp. D3o]
MTPTLLVPISGALTWKRRGLAEAILNAANLSGVNLRNACFDGTDATAANFTRADLEGATLYESNLEGALFVNANLSNTDLLQTPFYGTDLSHANLTLALHASLKGAILDNTTMPDGSIKSNYSRD